MQQACTRLRQDESRQTPRMLRILCCLMVAALLAGIMCGWLGERVEWRRLQCIASWGAAFLYRDADEAHVGIIRLTIPSARQTMPDEADGCRSHPVVALTVYHTMHRLPREFCSHFFFQLKFPTMLLISRESVLLSGGTSLCIHQKLRLDWLTLFYRDHRGGEL